MNNSDMFNDMLNSVFQELGVDVRAQEASKEYSSSSWERRDSRQELSDCMKQIESDREFGLKLVKTRGFSIKSATGRHIMKR